MQDCAFSCWRGALCVLRQTAPPVRRHMDCCGRTKTTGILAIRPAGTTIGIVSSMCDWDQVKAHFSHLAVKFVSGTKASTMRVGAPVLKTIMATSYSG